MEDRKKKKSTDQGPKRKKSSVLSKVQTWFSFLRNDHIEDEDPAAEKRVRRKVPTRLLLAYAIFGMALICIYPFTKEFQIRALNVTGNYYYSASQIYKIADVSVNNLMIFNSPSSIQSKLEENPLIQEASVVRNGQDLSITVDEKLIIGYYVKDNTNYLVTADDERIPIENEQELRTLIHYPLLVDLSDSTISKICEQTRKYPDQLTRAVYERIAEIQPWSESYDKNMLKLVLQDGNTVFTSIPSLFMMSTYSKILENLTGDNVCLLLDGENNVVNKVSCTYMYLSPEERAVNREIPKKVIDPTFKEETDEENKEEGTDTGNEETAGEEETQSAPIDPANIPQLYYGPVTVTTDNGEMTVDVSQISDWEAAAVENFQYSPSTQLFRAMDSGIVYTYEAATDTFWPI